MHREVRIQTWDSSHTKLLDALTRFMRQTILTHRVYLVKGLFMSKDLEERYPAIASWIEHGWIEIGELEMFGFCAMALDCGGMVYEDKSCKTLSDCMESLERGLREHMKERWGDEF